MENRKKTPFGARNWIALVLLAFSGQIAWVVENSWFNTFVNDMISPNPKIISTMVAASAIMATVTTLVMGTLSDRIGKRRILILGGYLLWGLSTLLFPSVSLINNIQIAVFMVVFVDCMMTFFGSTANDACFNAWITDSTDDTNRGTVAGISELFPLLAMVVATVAAGWIIESFGYFVFFFVLGIFVSAAGLAGSLVMKSAPVKPIPKGEGFFKQLSQVVSRNFIQQNKGAFILLACICVFSIGDQVFMPFQIIYFTDVLGYSKAEIGTYLGLITLLAGIVGAFFGRLVDRISRKKALLFSIIVSGFGASLLFFAKNLPLLCTGIFFMAFGYVARLISSGAWLRSLTPQDAVGQFQGVRMVFWVLLPMVIGPFIGERLISNFGEPVITNGETGFLPTPLIFITGAIIILISILPVLRLKDSAHANQI